MHQPYMIKFCLESARATDSSVPILIQCNLADIGYGDFSDTDTCIKTSLNLGCLRQLLAVWKHLP